MVRSLKKVVYSCSGCSSAAQMANTLAIRLDRSQIAEMSCIVGVGGGVPHLVRKAKEADSIIAIDGCAHHCVEKCLQLRGLQSTCHYDLSEMGVPKKEHEDFDPRQADATYALVLADLERKRK